MHIIVIECMLMQSLDELVKKVTCNEEILFWWIILSQDVESDEDSQELLYEIAHLWVTIT